MGEIDRHHTRINQYRRTIKLTQEITSNYVQKGQHTVEARGKEGSTTFNVDSNYVNALWKISGMLYKEARELEKKNDR